MIDYSKVDFAKILRRYDVEGENEMTPEAIAKAIARGSARMPTIKPDIKSWVNFCLE